MIDVRVWERLVRMAVTLLPPLSLQSGPHLIPRAERGGKDRRRNVSRLPGSG